MGLCPGTIIKYTPYALNFPMWLYQRGATIAPRTDSNDILRFEINGLHGSVINRNGHLTWSGEAPVAFDAYKKGKPYYQKPKDVRERLDRHVILQQLIARDGNECIVCGIEIPPKFHTIEHFIPVSSNGPNELSNLVLAHKACNELLGSMSIKEKVELIIAVRKQVFSMSTPNP